MSLGPMVREYPFDGSKARLIRAVSLALGAVGAVGLFVGGLRLASADWVRAAVLVVPGLLSVALGARTLLAIRRRAGQSVALVRDGLVRLDAGAAEAIPWSHVVEAWQDVWPGNRSGSTPGHLRVCVVRTLDGGVHRFDAFTDGLEQLSELIQQETARRLQAPFWASLERGESIRFGGVVLGQEGIAYGEKQLFWQSFRGITMIGPLVSIRAVGQDQPWVSLRVMELPNPLLFLQLVRSIAVDVSPHEGAR